MCESVCVSVRRTPRPDWSVPDQSEGFVPQPDQSEGSFRRLRRTPRPDWSVPDQSKRSVQKNRHTHRQTHTQTHISTLLLYRLAGKPASPRASTERLNINSLENRNALSGCFSLRTSHHDWSVPDQSERYVSPTNRKAPSDGSASRTPRPDWSVPDQSKRFVSPTNGKAPFDGS